MCLWYFFQSISDTGATHVLTKLTRAFCTNRTGATNYELQYNYELIGFTSYTYGQDLLCLWYS